MKLVRIGPAGEERPAVMTDDVIGQTARYLATPADAAAVIAGYTISNDVSERAFQLDRGGQWDKGKSCETFNPLGRPGGGYLQVGDTMRLEVDGLGAQQQTLVAA